MTEIDLLAWQAELLHACEAEGVAMPTLEISPTTRNLRVYYGDHFPANQDKQAIIGYGRTYTYLGPGNSATRDSVAELARIVANDFKDNAHKYYQPEEIPCLTNSTPSSSPPAKTRRSKRKSS